MTRKKWRKLMQAEFSCVERRGIMDTGKALNDLRHAKMVRGYDGCLYWSNTNNPTHCSGYAAHWSWSHGGERR